MATPSNAKILSEVYFNRALLWSVLIDTSRLRGQSKWIIASEVLLLALNLWKSFKAYCKEDE